MKRTIVRCEACGDVFTGIYTNGGELIVRGWSGCPKCGESALRDIAAEEGSGPRREDRDAGPNERLADDD